MSKHKSRIDSNVFYEVTQTIAKDDVGERTYVFRGRIYEQDIEFVLGRPNERHIEKNIVFYNIYLVKDEAFLGRIGVYEIFADVYRTFANQDGPDINKFNEPLIFNLAKQVIYDNFKAKTENMVVAKEKVVDMQDMVTIAEDKPNYDTDNLSDGDNDESEIEDADADADLESDPSKFVYSAENDTWINVFFKSHKYMIHSVPGDGDCFFTVVKTALKTLKENGKDGKLVYPDITVKQIRGRVADELTEDQFSLYTILYEDAITNGKKAKEAIKGGKVTHNAFKRQIGGSNDVNLKQELLQKAGENLKQIGVANSLFKIYGGMADDYNFMNGIKTFDDMKALIRKSGSVFWADEWSIAVIERIYNIKMIIFDGGQYGWKSEVKRLTKAKASTMSNKSPFKEPDSVVEPLNTDVIKCGDFDDKMKRMFNIDGKKFMPDYYIMADYVGGNHYNLITYDKHEITEVDNKTVNGRAAFKFSEIPDLVKVLVINKCICENSQGVNKGYFSQIQDFITYARDKNVVIDKCKEIIRSKSPSPSPKSVKNASPKSAVVKEEKELFIANIVIKLTDCNNEDDKNSCDRPVANGAFNKDINGEVFKRSEIDKYGPAFETLYKIADWRLKLMDSWLNPINIDDQTWFSVQHYMYAIGLKNIDKKNAYYSAFLQDEYKNIDVAHKYYMVHKKKTRKDFNDEAKSAHLYKALMIKFSDADLKKILLLTWPAKLLEKRSNRIVTLEELMKVRRDLL